MLDIGYYTSEALTLLQALIGIPSISREEEAAADFLQNYIEETGIMTGRSGNNIWCISPMFNTQRPTILLNSHIDTVKPVNGWRAKLQPYLPCFMRRRGFRQKRNRKCFTAITSYYIGSRWRTDRNESCYCRKGIDGT